MASNFLDLPNSLYVFPILFILGLAASASLALRLWHRVAGRLAAQGKSEYARTVIAVVFFVITFSVFAFSFYVISSGVTLLLLSIT